MIFNNFFGLFNQNLKPKFAHGSNLYLGALLSISSKEAGKLVLTGQYLMA
jgi:hypothetical protein